LNKRQAREFEAFVAESGSRLLRLATLLLPDRGVAEDVFQETLQRVATKWEKTDSPAAFSRKVLHNLVIDWYRAASRRPRKSRDLVASDADVDLSWADSHVAAEVRPALLKALDSLGVQQRTVVVLRYFEDRPESEVAELLDISVGTVKSTASRSLAALKIHPDLIALLDTNPAGS
jgi:RNA polymerase sigma-70 factor (sigma-E family)